NYAVGGVQPGMLVLIDLSTFQIVGVRSIGTGVDAVAVTQIGGQLVAVMAIENEGVLPAGFVEVVRIDLSDFANSPGTTVQFTSAALTAAGLLVPDNPQPEFVSIRGTKAAVTLQENNGIAIIDISDPAAPVLEALFSAGIVADRSADLLDNAQISFTDTYPFDKLPTVPTAGARLPDAVAWSADGSTLFTADEGEANFTGGRGWSARTSSGAFLFDDGGKLEATAVRFGHYPDGRSDAKGIEAEGVVVDEFGHREFMFVTSERGAFVAVYRIGGLGGARFLQLLPTGIAPEGILTIAGRKLLITANEGDDGVGGTISIFKGVSDTWESPPHRPTIVSRGVDEPWGALSGLTAHRWNSDVLYAVPDNALPSSIFKIELDDDSSRAVIREKAPVTKLGVQVRYDLEGIDLDTSIRRPESHAGFWLASEGNASTTKNTLVQVDRHGEVFEEVILPASVDAPGGKITSNGFEGITVSGDGRYLVVAIQRPFTGDAPVGGVIHTRIARYDLQLNAWEAFFYPLVDSPGTIGLSEITLVGRTNDGGDVYAVIERDNRIAAQANIKRIYAFTFESLVPVGIEVLASDTTILGATVTKTLIRDVLPLFTPYEKVEGLTLTRHKDLWVVLDNDGGEVESRLVRIRRAFKHSDHDPD
ncbi:MAG: esterase-like activity of phytase family protein, partial [Vicinamibacterales bacterium]